MNFVIYVNNLTPSIISIINVNDKIFMHSHCVYPTNNPTYLTLLPSPFQTGQVHSCLSTFLFFFFLTKDFLFKCFCWLFCFQFWFVLFRFNLIFFVNFGYFSLVLLQFSFTKWTSNDFNFFPTPICK